MIVSLAAVQDDFAAAVATNLEAKGIDADVVGRDQLRAGVDPDAVGVLAVCPVGSQRAGYRSTTAFSSDLPRMAASNVASIVAEDMKCFGASIPEPTVEPSTSEAVRPAISPKGNTILNQIKAATSGEPSGMSQWISDNAVLLVAGGAALFFLFGRGK